MNLFIQDEKSSTAKHFQVANTLKLDNSSNSSNENNNVAAAKVYMDARPHKDLLSSSKVNSQLHSKDVQVTQGVKQ